MQFVNRKKELARLHGVFAGPPGGMVCVWGRRRLGKSRLLLEALRGKPTVFVVGDDRAAPLQRAAVAREIGRQLPGFDRVSYPNWDTLLERYWQDAPAGSVLILDELPALVAQSPELPGVLQRLVDRGDPIYLAVCGSSQRMMHGIVLSASSPLYGRASEVLRLDPMAPRWLGEALTLTDPDDTVRRFAIFGGIPRYWELIARHPDLYTAIRELVLDPLGVLHDEPERLLLDDAREIARAASILGLIGQGCSRSSEIAGRMGQPASTLARPLERLTSLGLVQRETPFGALPRDSKRSIYRIADPLLAFWYRFVEPNRALLASGGVDAVADRVRLELSVHMGHQWDAMVRWRIPRARLLGRRWGQASRWWGTAGRPLEIDAIAENTDSSDEVLVVEAKVSIRAAEAPRLRAELAAKAEQCPALQGKRPVLALWSMTGGPDQRGADVLGPEDVLDAE
jgi:AAA+ ATPase superfamily predicted ATPase